MQPALSCSVRVSKNISTLFAVTSALIKLLLVGRNIWNANAMDCKQICAVTSQMEIMFISLFFKYVWLNLQTNSRVFVARFVTVFIFCAPSISFRAVLELCSLLWVVQFETQPNAWWLLAPFQINSFTKTAIYFYEVTSKCSLWHALLLLLLPVIYQNKKQLNKRKLDRKLWHPFKCNSSGENNRKNCVYFCFTWHSIKSGKFRERQIK